MDFADEAQALLAEVARRDELARTAAYEHLRRRADAGGLNAGAAMGETDVIGSREQLARMIQYRLDNGDAATIRRARAKFAELQLQARSGRSSRGTASLPLR